MNAFSLAPFHELDAEMADCLAEFERADREGRLATKSTTEPGYVIGTYTASDVAHARQKVEAIRAKGWRASPQSQGLSDSGLPVSPLAGTAASQDVIAPAGVAPRPAEKKANIVTHKVAAPATGHGAVAPVSVAAEERFPAPDPKKAVALPSPARALEVLAHDLRLHNDYRKVRSQYVQLSAELNWDGRLAPAFRQSISVRAKAGDPIHMLIHRDMAVIDYHWCHATKMLLSPLDADHAALLLLDREFSFEDAWRLACKPWKGTYRAAEALCLTTLQQCQTVKLHGPEVSGRMNLLSGGWRASGGKASSRVATARRLIGEWAERDKRIANARTSYESLWLARELLGPNATVDQIGKLHALMLQQRAPDRATIRDKLKSLNRELPPT